MNVVAASGHVHVAGLGWLKPDRFIVEAANWGLVRFNGRHPQGASLWQLPSRDRYTDPQP